MATIYVDNKAYAVAEGQNLLQACLTLGFDLPYFCWHPAMHSVGACRQCAVKLFKDENDHAGRIVMACMTPATDGVRISIDDPEAKAFRAGVIEFLMVNHPHDCPVCDEGGECHLQDMTVMTGHVYRRTRFPKRTHRDQNLGPFVNHEMNRCIQCYRCVRFYCDYAGGRDFGVFGWHNHVYFGRSQDGTLQSEFSGNLVEVCPTGVFTDKTLKRHYTRKWDLQTAPSVCVHCGLGCNTLPGERYGQLRRIRNRYNEKVNGYFLCDRGRYGYEFVNSDKRIREPMTGATAALFAAVCSQSTAAQDAAVAPDVAAPQRAGSVSDGANQSAGTRSSAHAEDMPARISNDEIRGGMAPGASTSTAANCAAVAPGTAIARAAAMIRDGKAIGIGSQRASIEGNFALRELVGPENFYFGGSDQDLELARLALDVLRGPVPAASLSEAGLCDAVFVLGEDLTNTAPMLALALRQSVLRRPLEAVKKMHIFAWDDAAVREAIQLDRGPLFVASTHATKLDHLAGGVYHSAPDDLARLGHVVARTIKKDLPFVEEIGESVHELAHKVAEALREAKNPLIVAGASCGSAAVIRAAADVAWALREQGHAPKLSLVVGQCNTMGLAMCGANPISKALAAVRNGQAQTVVVLESDLCRFMPKADADALLAAPKVIVLDQLATETVNQALKYAHEGAMPPPAQAGAGMRATPDMPAQVPNGGTCGGMAPGAETHGRNAHATVIFSAATFAESTGTLVNNEGRAQRFFQVFVPPDTIRPSWRWLSDVGQAAGKSSMKWANVDHVLAALARTLPAFAGVEAVAPGADFRAVGQKMPRQPLRYSGRTAITADADVSEPKPPADPDSPMAFSMEGFTGQPPEPLLAHYWAPGWNSVQALNKFQQEVGGLMKQSLPGVILVKPADIEHPSYFGDPPPAYHPRKRSLLVMPAWHIFGSDEQSVLSPGVKELSPQPYLAIGAADAKCLGLAEGDTITITLAGNEESLPVRIRKELRSGLALAPMGLSGRPCVQLPAWGQIVRPEAGP